MHVLVDVTFTRTCGKILSLPPNDLLESHSFDVKHHCESKEPVWKAACPEPLSAANARRYVGSLPDGISISGVKHPSQMFPVKAQVEVGMYATCLRKDLGVILTEEFTFSFDHPNVQDFHVFMGIDNPSPFTCEVTVNGVVHQFHFSEPLGEGNWMSFAARNGTSIAAVRVYPEKGGASVSERPPRLLVTGFRFRTGAFLISSV